MAASEAVVLSHLTYKYGSSSSTTKGLEIQAAYN
jgi:hypothetical protein